MTSQPMNIEARGPEEIRAALDAAISTAGEQAEDLGGIAAVLTEAADRYESLQMAASTLEHLRDAAAAAATAGTGLAAAEQELQAALTDFNNRDGLVADAVTDTGHLAGAPILVDTGEATTMTQQPTPRTPEQIEADALAAATGEAWTARTARDSEGVRPS
jgi:hypothetical protein